MTKTMKIELDIKSMDNIGEFTKERLERYTEIFTVLIEKGALDGVRGGKAIIHFDPLGIFQAVQLDYSPWRRRKN